MGSLWTTGWVYFISAGVLVFLALLAGWRGLFRDRAGGRKRCRKCWYDLASLVASEPVAWPIICPECGRQSLRMNDLTRTRRWKRWIALAVFLFGIASVLAMMPKAQRDGWWSIPPTWLIVRAERVIGLGRWDGLDAEVVRRTVDGRIRSDDQAAMILASPELITIRPRWPRGIPVRIRTGRTLWVSGTGLRVLLSINARGTEHDHLSEGLNDQYSHEQWWTPAAQLTSVYEKDGRPQAMVIGWFVHEYFGAERAFEWAERVDDILAPVQTEAALKAATHMAQGRLTQQISSNTWGLSPGELLTLPTDIPRSTVFGLRAEFLDNGRVVGIARWHQRAGEVWPKGFFVPIFHNGSLVTTLPFEGGTVRITSDDEMALCDFDATSRWTGSFEFPIGVLLRK